MHILYKFNLAEDKYLQLVTLPESLIESLYMDGRILNQAESVNLTCPGEEITWLLKKNLLCKIFFTNWVVQ